MRPAQRVWVAAGMVAVWAAVMVPVLAQSGSVFSTRLSWVPISGAERNDVGGSGTAEATLKGSALSVSGSFEGLPAAAAAARLHQGVIKGARGPAIADLTITRAASGKISGTVTLTSEQVRALAEGRLYVQVYGEKGVAPDNSVLWGWLLTQKRDGR